MLLARDNNNDHPKIMLSRAIITEVLGELEFSFYHRWFDVIFLVSQVVKFVIITIILLLCLQLPYNYVFIHFGLGRSQILAKTVGASIPMVDSS